MIVKKISYKKFVKMLSRYEEFKEKGYSDEGLLAIYVFYDTNKEMFLFDADEIFNRWTEFIGLTPVINHFSRQSQILYDDDSY